MRQLNSYKLLLISQILQIRISLLKLMEAGYVVPDGDADPWVPVPEYS